MERTAAATTGGELTCARDAATNQLVQQQEPLKAGGPATNLAMGVTDFQAFYGRRR